MEHERVVGRIVSVERVGVVGGGLMGSGIAEVCASAGCDVVVRDVSEAALAGSRHRIEVSLQRAARAGKIAPDRHGEVFDRIRFTTDLAQLSACQLVVEAVIEAEADKVAVFAELDDVIAQQTAVLASNTSSIPIMKLAMATRRPEAVIGMHFFNPVPILSLVEIVPSLLTNPETLDAARRFAEEVLGKKVIQSQDRAGFVANALLIPYILSAIRMLESGFASAVDIDAAMVEGCAHPMGPLALADLIGLDTTMAVAESLYAEFKEPLYAPPALLSRMVEAGLFGRKAAHGFYEYP